MENNPQPNPSTPLDSANQEQELGIFRSIVANLANGVVVQRRDGSVVLINQAAADMLGFTIEAASGMSLVLNEWDAVDIDGHAVPVREFPGPRALRTGQPSVRQVLGVRQRRRAIRWIEVDSYPLSLPGADQPHGVASSLRDITDKVAATRTLEEANRRTEIILAKSGNEFRILDWYGNVIDAVPPLIKRGIFESAELIEVDGLPHVKYLGSSHAEVVEIFERVRGKYLASESHDVFVDSPVGGRHWVEFSLTNHLDDPAVGGIVVNYRDITARKESESQIRFQADLLARAGQAIIATDEHGHIVFWNQIAVEIYGWTADDAHDRHITDVIGSGDDNDVAEYGRATARCEQWSGDLTIHRRDGTLFAICVSSVPVFDANGGFIAVVGVSTDINERKASALALAEQASHDPLTGLVNRPMLMQEIETQLVTMQSSEIGFAVLFIGLDRFKVINEGTSHAVGDRILQLVSERLIATFPDEVVARFGSDEFVVLYRESSQSAVESMAGRVIDELQQPFKVDNHELVVGASMGISYAANNDTADSLLRDANAAMYEAKQGGRSQSRTYDNRSRKRAKERLNTEVGLRSAIDHGELFVEYQPMVSLLDNSIYGVEALVRWKHPLLGRISPDHFIPVAEETGLIIPIGRWVLDQALGQKVEWARHGVIPNATINVNLSPRQLLDPTLVGSVEAAIDLSGIDPQKLTLEITENSLMHDIERSISVLERLSEMGVRLAVDDFGTGHSSMMYLQRLPIDVLKIDGSFVSGLGTNSGDSSIVRAISGLGEALDLAVVAEGVETETQLAALKGLHCNYGQGFLWSPALGGPELASWATATT